MARPPAQHSCEPSARAGGCTGGTRPCGIVSPNTLIVFWLIRHFPGPTFTQNALYKRCCPTADTKFEIKWILKLKDQCQYRRSQTWFKTPQTLFCLFLIFPTSGGTLSPRPSKIKYFPDQIQQDLVLLTPLLTPSQITSNTGWLHPPCLILKQEIFPPLSLHKE